MEGEAFEKQMFSTNRRGPSFPIQTASSTCARCPTSNSKTKNVPTKLSRSQVQFLPLPKKITHAGTLHQYLPPLFSTTKKELAPGFAIRFVDL